MCAHLHLRAGPRPPRQRGGRGKSFVENKRPLAKEQVENSAEWVSEFGKVCPYCAAAGILPSHFRYSPGWVTLWHAHAQQLVDMEVLHNQSISTWGWSKLVNGIPDESYWSTLANKLGHPIHGELTTYMEPGDAKTGHSRMFREGDVDRLWRTGTPNFFARKFPTTPKMDAALSERKAAKATEMGTAWYRVVNRPSTPYMDAACEHSCACVQTSFSLCLSLSVSLSVSLCPGILPPSVFLWWLVGSQPRCGDTL